MPSGSALKETLGLASYILAFSGGLWCWPATLAVLWFVKSTILRALIVVYLYYIWFGPGRLQPGNPEGSTVFKRCELYSLPSVDSFQR